MMIPWDDASARRPERSNAGASAFLLRGVMPLTFPTLMTVPSAFVMALWPDMALRRRKTVAARMASSTLTVCAETAPAKRSASKRILFLMIPEKTVAKINKKMPIRRG